jgi:chromosome segregation ATPase
VITDFIAQLLSSMGLSVNAAILLGGAAALAVIILSVALALSRRIDRLEESLMDLRQLHTTMQETQTSHARVVKVLGSIASALPDLDEFKHHFRGANSRQSELIATTAKVSIDLESVRETVVTRLPDIKADLATLQKSMEDYHVRMEMMQATMATLPTIQNEQHKICKLLRVINSRFKDMEQTVASVPSIKAEQVQVQNEVAEWNSRFNAAAEALAELFPSEDLDQVAPLGPPEGGPSSE